MIKVGIIGSTGYAGGELVRILTGHMQKLNGMVPEVILTKSMRTFTEICFRL